MSEPWQMFVNLTWPWVGAYLVVYIVVYSWVAVKNLLPF